MERDIICFGRYGQLAMGLSKILPNARFVSSKECNFERPNEVVGFLSTITNVKYIINATAYNKVDMAEEEQEAAININCKSLEVIANYCKQNDIIFVSISTDYVFNGTGDEPYPEVDASEDVIFAPCNYYGHTKLEGEKAILKSGCKAYIIRTSWLYSEEGSNFVKTMVNLIKTKQELKVVSDQVGSPTYAPNLANAIKYILENNIPFGTFHFSDDGYVSWYEFACKIKDVLSKKYQNLANIMPVSSTEYQTKAKRPLNSRLEKVKLKEVILPLEQGLEICMNNIA